MIQATEWAAGIGLSHPIVCAPMGGTAGGRLASAVSRAGALGMIGMGSSVSPEKLRAEIEKLDDDIARPGTGGVPFGIGFVHWGLERFPEMLDIALEAGPALISVSFVEWVRDPDLDWISRVQGAGALAVTQVATADEARAAAAAGADVVVARGIEAGGHGDPRRPARELLREVLAAVEIPVLAAGAVSTAEDVADALDAGAAAVWVGTAFAACPESLTSEATRRVLLSADGSQTTVTRAADVAYGFPWPARFPERVVRNSFVERWHGREDELLADEAALAEFRAADEVGDLSVVPVNAGEGVGSLTEARPAAQVVASLVGRDPAAR